MVQKPEFNGPDHCLGALDLVPWHRGVALYAALLHDMKNSGKHIGKP